jgi:hypothetical protein
MAGSGLIRANRRVAAIGGVVLVVAFAGAARAAGPQGAGSSGGPVVDCARGGSINRALAAAPANTPVTIRVKGTCREAVTVARDKVTLQGASATAGITAPTDNGNALTLTSARRV